MLLRGAGEGEGGEPWIRLTVRGAETACYDLLTQLRDEAEDCFAIHKVCIGKAELMLEAYKFLKLFGLSIILCQNETATLAELEICFQFICERRPALDGGA